MKQPSLLQTRERRLISRFEGAWGDNLTYEVAIPEGFTAESYVKALCAEHRYAYPAWKVQDGRVIEEDFRSLGD